MIGSHYWMTGITITKFGDKWGAKLEFYDDGFCQNDSSEGELRLRYLVSDIFYGASVLAEDARRLGIAMGDSKPGPSVYCEQDGEFDDGDRPDLRLKANEVARYLGWKPIYRGDDPAVVDAVERGQER